MDSENNLFHSRLDYLYCVCIEVVIGDIAAVVVRAGDCNIQNIFWGFHKCELDYILRWLRWLILKKLPEKDSNLVMTCRSIHPQCVVALEQFTC